jgi:hypothetical protein
MARPQITLKQSLEAVSVQARRVDWLPPRVDWLPPRLEVQARRLKIEPRRELIDPRTCTMASDAFLKISDIPGESTDAEHKDWNF